MTTTNFPNGITSFGIPIYGGGAGRVAASAPGVAQGVASAIGNTWFVDTVFGGDGNSGESPQAPFATMEAAFDRLRSGDVINFRGRISEQLVAPVQVFDVWINGLGNRPRHADTTPLGGRYAASQWGPPASGGVAAQATLRVLQQGWRFTNFLWTAIDLNAACLEIVRNAGAGDAERDASHAQVLGCRFSGAGIGIRCGVAGLFTEIPYNVEVGFSQFDNMTYGIRGALAMNQWHIHDNVFGPNTNQIIVPALNCLIRNNSIGPFTAAANSGGIDLSGAGATGTNQVTGNNLSGTYSNAGGYVAGGAGDNWYGNWASTSPTVNDPA